MEGEMSEGAKKAIVAETLKAFVAYVSGGREIAKAKEAAGKLHFWGEGMLDEIKKIAEGKAKPKTYKDLQKKFDANDEPAREAMGRLRQMRNKHAGNHIARAIERCIQADGQGKNKILYDISNLLHMRKSADAPLFASEVIRDIEVLNANLDHLHRLLEAER
jgi:hypothetical protein